MFLMKRERPETDDFAIKKYGCEGKITIFKKNAKCFASVSRHSYKNILKMSLHILVL